MNGGLTMSRTLTAEPRVCSLSVVTDKATRALWAKVRKRYFQFVKYSQNVIYRTDFGSGFSSILIKKISL